MLKAIIFDMDGVLLDSTQINFKSFNLVLEKYKIELNSDNIKNNLGRSLRDQLNMWKKEYPKIPQNLKLEDFSKEAFQYQMKLIKENLKPDKNIIRLIQEAKKNNIKIAVATSSLSFRAEQILKFLHIINLLDTITTAEDVENHKPNPDVFLETAKKLNVNPDDCLVIEDAINGITAAKKANMIAVAKLTKYLTKDDFSNADYIFEDFKDITLHDFLKLYPNFDSIASKRD